MKDQSLVGQNVERVFSEFFATGQHDGTVHTLHLAHPPSEADESTIKSALSDVGGVKGVHVEREIAAAYIIYSGPQEPLIEALHQAGFDVKAPQ